MLPGFAGEFARKDALVPRRDCAHLAAKPCVSQSLPLTLLLVATNTGLPARLPRF